jgi:hypothetical protein
VKNEWKPTQFREVEAVAEHGKGTGTSAGTAEPPKFNGTTSWAVFWRQFETVAEHNCWMCHENSTYVITVLQGRATDVLHRVPKGATYEETFEALEDCFGDQHLATVYRSQLKARTQDVGEPLQEFATTVEQLSHHAYPTLPEDHIRRARHSQTG